MLDLINSQSIPSGGIPNILIFLIVAFGLAGIIVLASYVLAITNPEPEKNSCYECGFDPFGDSRQKFEVRFFLVGILFIIFDLEISFLVPWSAVLERSWDSPLWQDPLVSYWTMAIFLIVLTVGFIYEIFKGGLEWE